MANQPVYASLGVGPVCFHSNQRVVLVGYLEVLRLHSALAISTVCLKNNNMYQLKYSRTKNRNYSVIALSETHSME